MQEKAAVNRWRNSFNCCVKYGSSSVSLTKSSRTRKPSRALLEEASSIRIRLADGGGDGLESAGGVGFKGLIKKRMSG